MNLEDVGKFAKNQVEPYWIKEKCPRCGAEPIMWEVGKVNGELVIMCAACYKFYIPIKPKALIEPVSLVLEDVLQRIRQLEARREK